MDFDLTIKTAEKPSAYNIHQVSSWDVDDETDKVAIVREEEFHKQVVL